MQVSSGLQFFFNFMKISLSDLHFLLPPRPSTLLVVQFSFTKQKRYPIAVWKNTSCMPSSGVPEIDHIGCGLLNMLNYSCSWRVSSDLVFNLTCISFFLFPRKCNIYQKPLYNTLLDINTQYVLVILIDFKPLQIL